MEGLYIAGIALPGGRMRCRFTQEVDSSMAEADKVFHGCVGTEVTVRNDALGGKVKRGAVQENDGGPVQLITATSCFAALDRARHGKGLKVQVAPEL